jgi:MFS family permease
MCKMLYTRAIMTFDASEKSIVRRYFIYRGLLSRVYVPILAVYMLHQGISLEHIAIIAVVSQIISLIFEIPSGAIADTLGHRRTLVIAMLGEAAASLLFLGGSFSWILAGSIIYCVFASLQSGTSEALFFEYLQSIGKHHDHLKMLGRGKSISWAMNMLAVFLGGVSYTVHPMLPFFLGSLAFAAAAMLIRTFPQPQTLDISVQKKEGFAELLQHFPRAISTIRQHPSVFWFVIINGLLIGTITGSEHFQQIIFTNLGALPLFIGFIYATKRGLSVMLSGYAYRLQSLSLRVIMGIFTGITVLSLVLTPFIASAILYGGIVLCLTVVLTILDVLFTDYLNHAIPSLSRATTLSIANFIEAGIGIGAAAVFTVNSLSVEHAFFVLGTGIILLSIVPFLQLMQQTLSMPKAHPMDR